MAACTIDNMYTASELPVEEEKKIPTRLHKIYELRDRLALLCHQMVWYNKKGKYSTLRSS